MEYEISTHRHNDNFTIIPNEILRNESLSFFDKGLLCYLLSLPKDWKINVSYISGVFGESERAILKSIKSLIENGYCKRTPLRRDGRLCGQHYQITDIANDFSVPSKNEGAEIADPAESRPTEKADPQKNEGADKEYSLFNEETIEDTKNESVTASRKKPETIENICLFVNSKFYDYDIFAAQFTGPEYQEIDIAYYYGVVMDWSSSKGVKRKDWIAQTRNIMRKDKDANKLHLLPKNVGYGDSVLSPEAIKYLEMGRL